MLMIILHHIVYIWGGPSYLRFTSSWGFLGTGMFFLLSGYGLYVTLSSRKSLPVSWILGKLKNLLFPFYFTFACYSLFLLAFDQDSFNKTFLVSLCQLRIPNTTTWFLKAIIGLYILTFFVFKLKISNIYRVLLIFLTTFSFFVFAYHFLSAEWYWSILNFPLGMIIGLNINKLNNCMNMCEKKFLFILVVYFGLSNFLHVNVLTSILFSLMTIVAMVYFNPTNKILDYIGRKSINFYLFQMIFLHLGLRVCSNFILYACFVLFLTFILSLGYDKITAKVK